MQTSIELLFLFSLFLLSLPSPSSSTNLIARPILDKKQSSASLEVEGKDGSNIPNPVGGEQGKVLIHLSLMGDEVGRRDG